MAADQSAVTNAQLNLEFTEIRAPFNGQTGALQFHEGNVVKAPDDTLLTINQTQPIYVEFAVPERYLPEIRKQMNTETLKVLATFENMTVAPPQGELTFIDNSVGHDHGHDFAQGNFSQHRCRALAGTICASGIDAVGIDQCGRGAIASVCRPGRLDSSSML